MLVVVDYASLMQVVRAIREKRSPIGKEPTLRIAAEDGSVTLTANEVEGRIPADVRAQGAVFVPIEWFRRLLVSLAGQTEVRLEVDDGAFQFGNVSWEVDGIRVVHFGDPNETPPRWPMTDAEFAEWRLRREHSTSIGIVRRHFQRGLSRICDPRFLSKRYDDFRGRQDPVYCSLLDGMQDEALAKTFVSYWTIAHTLATRSRFWIETAIAEILIDKYQKEENAKDHYVLSHGLLSRGHLREPTSVADMGEEHLEHLSGKGVWRTTIDLRALQRIDLLVGEHERMVKTKRKPFERRSWTDTQNRDARNLDQAHLDAVANSLNGQAVSEVNLQCNLLVIEPYKVDKAPHAWAFRFVNPKSLSSHAQRKQERVNLLRLFALLVQEKIVRKPESIKVCVAELVPRRAESDFEDRFPDYFSPDTFWTNERFWQFVGVPFESVTLAIGDVAAEFRNQLIEGLRRPPADGNVHTEAPV